MHKIQVTRFFENKDKLLNFIGVFLQQKTMAFFPDNNGWKLVYETTRDTLAGELQTDGPVEVVEIKTT